MNIEDRLELQDLVHRYAYFVDSFEIAEWVTLFAPDGILDESEFGMGRFVGHDALLAYGQAIADRVHHLVHLMSNQIIWEIRNDTARGTSFAIVESMSKAGARARYQVKYEDQFRRLDGRWVFQERMLRTSFPPEAVSSGPYRRRRSGCTCGAVSPPIDEDVIPRPRFSPLLLAGCDALMVARGTADRITADPSQARWLVGTP